VFTLSYSESLLTQFAFFLSYGVMSLPAAMLVARKGSADAIIIALAAMVAGCLLIPLATALREYGVVLLALFVIGSGITLLQVAANPLAAALGPPARSHFRLTLSQAFNSLGTVLAPLVGSVIMLRGGVFGGGLDQEANRSESLGHIDTSFLIVAAVIALLATLLWRVRRLLVTPGLAPEDSSQVLFEALSSRWALAGAAAIFLYVGAEVSVASIIINFLMQPDILGISAEQAGRLLSLYWLGAMIGRFAGSALLSKMRAGPLLAAAALAAAILCLTVSQTGGMVAAVAVLAIGLFNSIMFPTIFTLTLERSSAPAPATSGLLCMAIVGGALLPQLVGQVADRAGLSLTFLVPALAYGAITLFAALAARTPHGRRTGTT